MSLLILPLEKVADKQRRPRTNFARELPWNYLEITLELPSL